MEDFVTYGQAVKLKELGFDYKTIWFYTCNGNLSCEQTDEIGNSHLIYENYNNDKIAQTYNVKCSAPTLAQVQKWLRDVKDIDVHYHYGRKKWTYYWGKRWSQAWNEDEYDTPIEALSAGIDQVLDFLKENGK